MSGLYRYFVTIVVSCTTIALFGTLVFYPRTQSDPSVGVQTAIDQIPYDAATKSSIDNPMESTTSSASEVKYVVILTYQRCGSSFFGEVFNLNPDAFYAYEPLDSLYSALYGTIPGWNVPSDITSNRDGTLRIIPQVEISAVADFLRHLLTAEVDKLPTATLVHRFWTQFGNWYKESENYTACLQQQNLIKLKCYRVISYYCGGRFGVRPHTRIEQCRRILMNETNLNAEGLTPRTARMFSQYRACFQSFRERVDAHCTEILRKAIADRRLRATKVVRATMDSMEPLLQALPNLRIIHLVRDPRAVTLSRHRCSPSVRGLYSHMRSKSGSRFVPEATLYCNRVTADIRSRLALEREFPGRIMFMKYEDVLANPEQRFRDIYKLLDEPMPTTTLEQMQLMASRGQQKNLTTKWQNVLNLTDQREIAHRCSDFFQLIGVSPDEISITPMTVAH